LATTAALYRAKSRAESVGRQLWLSGFRLDERYWQPWLVERAATFDEAVDTILQMLDSEQGLPFEELLKGGLPGPIGSRVAGCVSGDAPTSVISSLLQRQLL
jgi:hypothetical protein